MLLKTLVKTLMIHFTTNSHLPAVQCANQPRHPREKISATDPGRSCDWSVCVNDATYWKLIGCLIGRGKTLDNVAACSRRCLHALYIGDPFITMSL